MKMSSKAANLQSDVLSIMPDRRKENFEKTGDVLGDVSAYFRPTDQEAC